MSVQDKFVYTMKHLFTNVLWGNMFIYSFTTFIIYRLTC